MLQWNKGASALFLEGEPEQKVQQAKLEIVVAFTVYRSENTSAGKKGEQQ